jgi:hypothetical protein
LKRVEGKQLCSKLKYCVDIAWKDKGNDASFFNRRYLYARPSKHEAGGQSPESRLSIMDNIKEFFKENIWCESTYSIELAKDTGVFETSDCLEGKNTLFKRIV